MQALFIAGLANETAKNVNIVPENDVVFINSRFLPSKALTAAIKNLGSGQALLCEDILIAFRVGKNRTSAQLEIIENLLERDSIDRIKGSFNIKELKLEPINYLWDLVSQNSDIITREFSYFKKRRMGKIDNQSSLMNKSKIYISPKATIFPHVVIDATEGPVIIDENATVESMTYIKGPTYIGRNSRIVGGRIREGCSIGPVCRVGGEVEDSIILGYSNKYHEGFLGHAYLGEWVNLGAMTTNSDLKNNYANINVSVGERVVDSKQMKIGCFIGDHTKTGIGTLLNTGISIGFSCNLYGGSLFQEKLIKSFSWGTPDDLVEYRINKAIETASRTMARRDIQFSTVQEKLFQYIQKLDGMV